LVKSGPLAICDHGQGLVGFVRAIGQRVANRARKTFHNSDLRAGEIDYVVKFEFAGAT
jgi:hypothetical protein